MKILFNDEILSIEEIEPRYLMDIEVESDDHLFYANDILTHNSGSQVSEYDHSHIAGGISKISTADNVFGIFSNPSMKEQGVYKLQFMKTRSSSAVGQTIELSYDPVCMRITDPLISSDNINKPIARGALKNIEINKQVSEEKESENTSIISRLRKRPSISDL